ncbi:hypothetical protein K503DRAFT_327730 [Rhizopogon vinicolor AM-OR11-026]|uniref:RBR-type E3 ubiquitin transferase n=1 Tax=Rhizopogon vinicolor AM-OR11-026 TaxID=1314800 RepID=A0A1B7MU47_9AGAM|nr:hypothetical protein K503DRAFT_327730 [Rhizopogon vinicolor AM-OR11-026]
MASTFHHNGHDDVIVDILQGRERIVSYPATSQFDGHANSTCGLAAMNFARVFFELLHNHGQERLIDVLRAITSEEIIADIIYISSGWSSDLHLDVEDIQSVPPFDKALNHVSTRHGVPDAGYFTRTLQEMHALGSSAAVIITRPPETIACAKITGLGLDIFMIFDSHPRPNHPSGAGVILSTSIDHVVAHLISIFHTMTVDEHFLSESDSQSETQLLNNVSSHIFVSNGPPGDVRDVRRSAIESGLAILGLQAEIIGLKQQNARLISENEILGGDAECLEGTLSVQETTAGPSRLAPLFRQRAFGPRSRENHSTASPGVELELQQFFEDMHMPLDVAAVASATLNFSCAICMDEQPVDNTVELDCNHPICRDCVRGHVCAKIEEHRFPVLCPVCMTEQNDRPGVISGLVVQLIGVDEQQYAIWEEMELGQHSVLIHCRQCGRSVPVDKQEHEASQTLICPLPNCNHRWCKACQQPTPINSAPHSCDGIAELDNLMTQQGWKYCPNCRTPVERDGGCRHMTVRDILTSIFKINSTSTSC